MSILNGTHVKAASSLEVLEIDLGDYTSIRSGCYKIEKQVYSSCSLRAIKSLFRVHPSIVHVRDNWDVYLS